MNSVEQKAGVQARSARVSPVCLGWDLLTLGISENDTVHELQAAGADLPIEEKTSFEILNTKWSFQG